LAFAALNDASLLTEDAIGRVTRDEAVRLFVRQQVTPLLKRGQIGHYLRIFAWETLAPTSIWRDFIASEKLPILDQAEKIARRFLSPTAAVLGGGNVKKLEALPPHCRAGDSRERHP
jgi:hypothetical protein